LGIDDSDAIRINGITKHDAPFLKNWRWFAPKPR